MMDASIGGFVLQSQNGSIKLRNAVFDSFWPGKSGTPCFANGAQKQLRPDPVPQAALSIKGDTPITRRSILEECPHRGKKLPQQRIPC